MNLELPAQGKKKDILSCHITKFYVKNMTNKVLIVQLKSLITYFYHFKKKRSKFSQPTMILSGHNYQIQKVFGRFMVVHEKRDKTTKLIELGGNDYSKIVTNLVLSFSLDQPVEIESDLHADNFVIKYTKKHRTFTWEKFNKHCFLKFAEQDSIT